jgi:hypothetical protein
MLSREKLEEYEKVLQKEIVHRRQLGGYSPDANTLQTLCEMLYELLRDARERRPQPKSKKAEEE